MGTDHSEPCAAEANGVPRRTNKSSLTFDEFQINGLVAVCVSFAVSRILCTKPFLLSQDT